MLYDAYEVQRSLLAGASKLAGMGAGWLNNPSNPWGYSSMGPLVAASLEVFAHASAPRGKPEFGLHPRSVGRKDVPVEEEVVLRKPFGQLKHFAREGVEGGPSLLIVAPMSGHYATLLRGTVERLLPGHDVYITDWRDAKLVPITDGRFDLDDYIDYLIEFLEWIGERSGRTPEHPCRVPAGGTRICGDGADGAQKESLAAADADDDGRADRHSRGADRGQHAGDAAAARLVRAECHRDRADDLSGRRAGRSILASSSSPGS